jgi:HEAT repeat protein
VPKIRRAAIVALRGVKEPRVQKLLIEATLDPVAEVRREAVLALGYLRANESLPAFRVALSDRDEEVRRLAVDALSQFDITDVSDLIQATGDPVWRVRRQAMIGLSNYRSEPGEQVLVKALNDQRWEVVKEAIVSLGKLRTPVFRPLTPFFAHEQADIRMAAAVTAGEIAETEFKPYLETLLRDPDTGVQKAAKRALHQIGKQEMQRTQI